jgi:hypothetical protein
MAGERSHSAVKVAYNVEAAWLGPDIHATCSGRGHGIGTAFKTLVLGCPLSLQTCNVRLFRDHVIFDRVFRCPEHMPSRSVLERHSD